MTLQGDGSITARIDSIEYVHEWIKIIVMIRNTLDPDSENATVLIVPSGRVVFQYRSMKTGVSGMTDISPKPVVFPHWVRLTRLGEQFTGQHSRNSVTWEGVVNKRDPKEPTLIKIPMNETVHIGLAITSHNSSRTAEARISNVTVTGSVTASGPFTLSQDISFQTLSDRED